MLDLVPEDADYQAQNLIAKKKEPQTPKPKLIETNDFDTLKSKSEEAAIIKKFPQTPTIIQKKSEFAKQKAEMMTAGIFKVEE